MIWSIKGSNRKQNRSKVSIISPSSSEQGQKVKLAGKKALLEKYETVDKKKALLINNRQFWKIIKHF